jgi:hypothetical protein
VDKWGRNVTAPGKKKKPVGRPSKFEGKRYSWSIRLQEKYGDEIKAMAEREGLSISEACERQIIATSRLEHALISMEQENIRLSDLVQTYKTEKQVLFEASRQDKAKIAELEERLNAAYNQNDKFNELAQGIAAIMDFLADSEENKQRRKAK